MLAFTAIAPLLVAASSASALAFEKRAAPGSPGAVAFEYPPLRGWSSEGTSTAPCGGRALNGRSNYPLSGGDISLKLQRDAFNIQVSYSSVADVSSNADFSPLLPVLPQSYSGSKCFSAPDFSTLGRSVGDVVTMQVVYNTGPQNSTLYQCADVTLVDAASYVVDTSFTCANVTASTQTRGQGGTTASAAIASSSSGSKSSSASSSSDDELVSPLGAGFIGAAVALVVFAAIAGLAVFAGFAKVGRRSKVNAAAASSAHADVPAYQRGDAASMTSRGSMVKA